MVRKLFFITLMLVMFCTLCAVPAYPGMIDFKQPDNSIVKIRLFGDEKISITETEDGYTLLFNKDGFYEYAKLNEASELVTSGIIANSKDKRSANENESLRGIDKHLRYNQAQKDMLLSIYQIRDNEMQRSFPPTGNRKLIMILMGFTDKAFTKTQADFNNLMNQANYTANGAFGSVKQWFSDNSFNQLTLTTDIAGPFTASNNMAYYGANTDGSHNIRPRELVTEAINLANPTVDFSEYDNDNDGSVDGVYMIFAGYGEEAGGGVNCIWSHAWSIPTVTLDGVAITRYSCSPELSGSSGTTITNIGVICHEFSHVCGLLDYYDTDYSGSGGQSFDLGDWDVMAGGSWNDGGKRPPFHNCYSRSTLGWQTLTVLNEATQISLQNSATQTVAYRYNTPTNNEYFMVENRQLTSWDAYIPHHGMLIYHVDKNWDGWDSNDINSIPTHQGMDIEEADNSQSSSSVTGDPFPGSSNKTTFTDTTTPNSKSWANANTAKPITNIIENNGQITFDFMGGDIHNPLTFTALPVSVSGIDLAWTTATGFPNVIIAVNTVNTFGNPINGVVYNLGNTISGGGQIIYQGNNTSFQHTGLTSGTTYYYKIWAIYDTNSYSIGKTVNATTQLPPLFLPYTQNFNASTLLPVGWQITDIAGSGQVWQIGSFAAGLTNSGNYAYLDSDGYGSGNTQNSDLISPLFNLSNYTTVNLQFKHYFKSSTGSSGKLYYSINGGQSWTLIQTWTASTTNGILFNQNIAEVIGQANVKFKWNYQGSYAWSWSVDDINITGIDNTPVTANFSANQTTAYTNQTLIFTPNCTGSITSYLWNFGEGATPQTANTVGPHNVIYSTIGSKTVSLTVNTTITETKTDYLTILTNNAPVNLTGTPGNSFVVLNWQAPALRDLVSYKVYRNNSFLSDVALNTLTYTDSSATNNTAYTYYVTANYNNPTGESNPSNSVVVTPIAPILPAPQNLLAQIHDLSINLTWDLPSSHVEIRAITFGLIMIPENNRVYDRNLLGFKIYRNTTLVDTVDASESSYSDSSAPFGQLSYYVTAVYTDGESNPSNTQNISFTNPNLFAPKDLIITKMANNVTLEWPFATSKQWLHYDNGVMHSYTGSINDYTMIGAIRFAPEQLQELNLIGKRLIKIKFQTGDLDADYSLFVWQGGSANPLNPGQSIHSESIEPYSDTSWNEFTLNDTIRIAANSELWFGVGVTAVANTPSIAIETGPMINNYGNIIYYNNSWTNMYEVNNQFVYDWMIEGEVDMETYPAPTRMILSNNKKLEMPFLTPENTRVIDVLGYNVYRNNQLLTTTLLGDTIKTYLDVNVPDGFYTYSVKAVYAGGESEPVTDTITVNPITISSFPYLDGFEGVLGSRDWVTMNLDNNDNTWYQLNSPVNSHAGENCMLSLSYDEYLGALNPDNWLITPRFLLPQVTNNDLSIKLTYWVATLGPNNPVEHYSVRLSTGGIMPGSFSNILLEEDANSPIWTQKQINLNAFAGQSVNLAFRHNMNIAQYGIRIDDFKISEPSSNDIIDIIPEVSLLSKNYPNPFNPSTTIEYSVKSVSPVKIEIYNIKGQKIKTLVNTTQNNGKYRVVWNGKDDLEKDMASGVYFCKMKTKDYTSTVKMMMIK